MPKFLPLIQERLVPSSRSVCATTSFGTPPVFFVLVPPVFLRALPPIYAPSRAGPPAACWRILIGTSLSFLLREKTHWSLSNRPYSDHSVSMPRRFLDNRVPSRYVPVGHVLRSTPQFFADAVGCDLSARTSALPGSTHSVL